MLQDLPFTLSDLRAAYAESVSPADLLHEVYARIAAVDDPAIFIHLRPIEDVIAEAEALPARSEHTPLWGIPFAVKDNIDLAGCPTTAACPDYAYTAERDAFVVARLRQAGALAIGKTNLDQFATGLVGVRSPYGVPRNCVDPEILPGGSSSGSAVAVGHGLVAFSLGTDTAGSGRVPAALNDIVGLKPSLGALSASGMVPACRTLDTISVFAPTVADAYAVFEIACAFDAGDAYARPIEAAPPTPPARGVRIGVPGKPARRFFGDDIQAASFDDALARLRQLGAEIIDVDFSSLHAVAEMLYDGVWVAERYAVVEDLMRTNPAAFHPTTAEIIGTAERLSAADAFRGLYRLKELERQAQHSLSGIDCLAVPTIPTFYSRADLDADPVTPNARLGTYTNFVNLLDMCGIAFPTARRADGKPGSITLLGRSGMDGRLAGLAEAFIAAEPLPDATTARADEIALAVCGAHMSGMPLNHELTVLGGRFLRATQTAPRYRLYTLSGGPPERPGLLRIEKGAAIALEVWALPKTAAGAFLAGIPSPLCIGTVELADGTTAHGFLVETAGVQGAEDITHLGGWRAYTDKAPRPAVAMG